MHGVSPPSRSPRSSSAGSEPKTWRPSTRASSSVVARDVDRVAARARPGARSPRSASPGPPRRLVCRAARARYGGASSARRAAASGVERGVGTVLDEERAVGERDERDRVRPRRRARPRSRSRPIARAVDAVDARLLPRRARVAAGARQPAFAREPLVQRLAPPEEAHYALGVGVDAVGVERVLVDACASTPSCRARRGSGAELLGSSSIDAFMSREASRARSV